MEEKGVRVKRRRDVHFWVDFHSIRGNDCYMRQTDRLFHFEGGRVKGYYHLATVQKYDLSDVMKTNHY